MKQVEGLKSPTWLQKIQYVTNPVGYWQSAYQSNPDAFYAQGIDFGSPLLVFYTPEAARQIIENRKGHLTTTSFTSELRAIFGDTSFFTLEGSQHQQMRRLLMPMLHGKHLHHYGEIICNLTDQVFESIPIARPFVAFEVAQDISMQIMIQLLFGTYQQERYERIKALMIAMVSLFASNIGGIPLFFRFLQKDLGLASPWRNFVEQRQQIETLIYAEIEERRAHPEPDRKDILTLLMSVQDEQGKFLTHEELLGQVLSLLFTGNESTAASMAWSWYRVYRDREIQTQLLEEIRSLGDKPDPLSLFRLPYLSAVCNETLRMYPVTMFMIPRVVTSTTEINGFQVEPRTLVTVGTYLIHQREEIYPAAQEFKPERFLNHSFSPYEFLPFGGGMRSCIGAELALYQLKLVLATILSHYSLSLTHSNPVRPQRRNTILTPTRLRMIKQDPY